MMMMMMMEEEQFTCKCPVNKRDTRIDRRQHWRYPDHMQYMQWIRAGYEQVV